MNFENSTLHQLQVFSRSLPRPANGMHHFTNRAALSAIESQVDERGGRVSYFFGAGDVVSDCTDSQTNSILTAIQNQRTDLTLAKTTGDFPNGFMAYDKQTIYRLTSARMGTFSWSSDITTQSGCNRRGSLLQRRSRKSPHTVRVWFNGRMWPSQG